MRSSADHARGEETKDGDDVWMTGRDTHSARLASAVAVDCRPPDFRDLLTAFLVAPDTEETLACLVQASNQRQSYGIDLNLSFQSIIFDV